MPKRKCEYEGCRKLGETWAQGRDGSYTAMQVRWYCTPHAQIVADTGNPEYTVSCPKCGCHFGVN